MWPKFNMKTTSSSTTIHNAFWMSIKEYKTRCLERFVARSSHAPPCTVQKLYYETPTFNYMLKKRDKNNIVFAIS